MPFQTKETRIVERIVLFNAPELLRHIHQTWVPNARRRQPSSVALPSLIVRAKLAVSAPRAVVLQREEFSRGE